MTAAGDADIPQGPRTPAASVKAGDRVWASYKNAQLNVRGSFHS